MRTGLTFMVPAYLGCPQKEAVQWVPVLGVRMQPRVLLSEKEGQFKTGCFTRLLRGSISVPVQWTAWKDLCPTRPDMCRVGRDVKWMLN